MLTPGDQVRNLLGRYCDLMDAGDWAAVGDLFADGRLVGPNGSVLAAGPEAVAAFYERGTKLHDGSPRTKHLVLNTRLADDGDAIEARSSYVVLQGLARGGPIVPIIAGRYVDTFDRRPPAGLAWLERRFDVDLTADLSAHLTWQPPT